MHKQFREKITAATSMRPASALFKGTACTNSFGKREQ
jgi:hypothetical protein